MASTFPRWNNDNQPQFVLEFAQHLAQNHDVTVLAPYEKGSKIHERSGEIDIYRFPYTFPGTERLAYRGGMVNAFRESIIAKVQLPLFLLAEVMFGQWLIATKRIDIINAHWLFPQGFVASALKKLNHKKLVITTHGGDVEILKNARAKRLLKWPLITADAVTFVSRHNLTQASNNTNNPAEKWSVMPMGIDIPDNAQRRKGLALNVLFLGRLVEIKGVAYLIEGVAKAHKDGVNVHLNILGDGPSRPLLEELVEKQSSAEFISFRGFIGGQEKDRYLAESDVVVVSSIIDDQGNEEGLPVAALEAMAYGKVLIATRTGSLPELLEDGGGILIEQKSISAICSALKHITTNPDDAARMRKAARQKAAAYDWNVITNKFDLILDNI